MKIKKIYNQWKVQSYFLVQILQFFEQFIFCFYNMDHKLSPYIYFWNEMILKNAFEFSCKFKIIVHDSIFKIHYYMFNVYLFHFIIINTFLFKLTILIHNFFYHIDDFIICLWHLNIIHLQKIQFDAKCESPFLVITRI